jgi:hypothetical protein
MIRGDDDLIEKEPEPMVDEEGLIVPLRESKRVKPDIDHLDDAVEVTDDGQVLFLPKVGEKVVIERHVPELAHSWLDTNLYTVRAIDPETGHLRLMSEEYGHNAMSNFMEGILLGYVFKIPPKTGPWQHRQQRVKKVKLVREKPAKKERPIVIGAPVKKTGKGRPKGSKNRPKAEIEAEKKARHVAKGKKRVK